MIHEQDIPVEMKVLYAVYAIALVVVALDMLWWRAV